MVKSLNQLVYEVIELYRATYKVTDSLDVRLVAAWVQQTRAKLLKQRFDENMRFIDEHNVQDLGYVTLERVDASNYSTIEVDRSILRTSIDIPRTIDRKGHIGTFTRVASVDRLQPKINLVSQERALVSGNGKFNNNDIYAYLDGERMCFISKSGIHLGLKYVNIKGVFVNPIDAYEAVVGNSDYDWDLEYPISESIVRDMMDMIVKDNFRFVLAPLEDPLNNASDDLTNIPQK
ncbi:MAG TPA: hypothetical protein PLG47_03385 [Candidatus Dojkabacteria bacterium]|nr:hypothetical protein [Candidatus Dojkabacteria bacterium]